MIPIPASIPFIAAEGKKYPIMPALARPSIICNTPPMTTASKNISNEPIECNASKTTTANPAAGPLTPCAESLIDPTTIPPIIPAIRPENRGAPLARAIPRHSGMATNNTTKLAGMSSLK